jgi:sorbitol-6-phosphate 2-dehydrogenase
VWLKKSRALGRRSLAVPADVTGEADVQSMVQKVTAEFSRIDILVNAAGIVSLKPTIEYPVEEWERVISVNLKGTFICCKEVGKVMLSAGTGENYQHFFRAGLAGAGQ